MERNGINSRDLDNHITGHYGEDQFTKEDVKNSGLADITTAKLTKENYESAKVLLKTTSDGWCKITPLSGDHEENIFMATFTDDYRLLFEITEKGEISLLATEEQKKIIKTSLTQEEYDLQMASLVKYTWEWQQTSQFGQPAKKLLHDLEHLNIDQMLELVKKSGDVSDR